MTVQTMIMDEITGKIDKLKVREMIDIPEINIPAFDPQQIAMERMFNDLQDKEWQMIENIIRCHINNPIEGDLTPQKFRERNLVSVVYENINSLPFIQETTGGFTMTLRSSLIGVRQGDVIIRPDGSRFWPTKEFMNHCFQNFFLLNDKNKKY